MLSRKEPLGHDCSGVEQLGVKRFFLDFVDREHGCMRAKDRSPSICRCLTIHGPFRAFKSSLLMVSSIKFLRGMRPKQHNANTHTIDRLRGLMHCNFLPSKGFFWILLCDGHQSAADFSPERCQPVEAARPPPADNS